MRRICLRPPLRDLQRMPPVGYCPVCGGEEYAWEIPVGGPWPVLCSACAAGERVQGRGREERMKKPGSGR